MARQQGRLPGAWLARGPSQPRQTPDGPESESASGPAQTLFTWADPGVTRPVADTPRGMTEQFCPHHKGAAKTDVQSETASEHVRTAGRGPARGRRHTHTRAQPGTEAGLEVSLRSPAAGAYFQPECPACQRRPQVDSAWVWVVPVACVSLGRCRTGRARATVLAGEQHGLS